MTLLVVIALRDHQQVVAPAELVEGLGDAVDDLQLGPAQLRTQLLDAGDVLVGGLARRDVPVGLLEAADERVRAVAVRRDEQVLDVVEHPAAFASPSGCSSQPRKSASIWWNTMMFSHSVSSASINRCTSGVWRASGEDAWEFAAGRVPNTVSVDEPTGWLVFGVVSLWNDWQCSRSFAT